VRAEIDGSFGRSDCLARPSHTWAIITNGADGGSHIPAATTIIITITTASVSGGGGGDGDFHPGRPGAYMYCRYARLRAQVTLKGYRWVLRARRQRGGIVLRPGRRTERPLQATRQPTSWTKMAFGVKMPKVLKMPKVQPVSIPVKNAQP